MNTRMEDLHFSELFQQSLEIAEQMGEMTAPEELSLLGKQFLYFERYVKGIAPDYMLVQDPYIIKNIFPEEAARKMAELAEAEPDMLVDPDADF
jgi:predicted unusual protein kinase regulating ubiquinone biosynthesis (AarF/ABC1/UbiB family)